MRLREMSFTTTQGLVEFVNTMSIKSYHIQSIMPREEKEGPLKLTLVFWDEGEAYIEPLKEGEKDVSRAADGTFHREEEHLHAAIPQELARANIIYSKMNVIAEEVSLTEEAVESYLKRKSQERDTVDKIKKGVIMGDSLAILGDEERFKEFWEQAMELWKAKFPDEAFDIPPEDLEVEETSILVPLEYFERYPEGVPFYHLSLVVEVVFGEGIILEYF
jgi:hypothetical protein